MTWCGRGEILNGELNMADKTATYKGRTYKLLYLGKTKFGHKAKLAFMDGSKEFWVDSSLVTEGLSSRGRGTWTGCSCGSVEEYEKPSDCFGCRHDR